MRSKSIYASVHKVPCDALDLDLMIHFKDLNADGDSSNGTGIYYSDNSEWGRRTKFMIVLINIGPPRPNGFQEVAYIDPLPLPEDQKAPSLVRFRKLFENGAMPIDEAAAHFKVEKMRLIHSTFRVLLHEFGHALGLSDYYEPSYSKFCDPKNGTGIPDRSLMKGPDRFGLCEIDEEAVKSLAARFPNRSTWILVFVHAFS